MKIDIDRHGPRPMPNDCKNFSPPNFSLPTTFKGMATNVYLSEAHSPPRFLFGMAKYIILKFRVWCLYSYLGSRLPSFGSESMYIHQAVWPYFFQFTECSISFSVPYRNFPIFPLRFMPDCHGIPYSSPCNCPVPAYHPPPRKMRSRVCRTVTSHSPPRPSILPGCNCAVLSRYITPS
jgi:hypothetical protein